MIGGWIWNGAVCLKILHFSWTRRSMQRHYKPRKKRLCTKASVWYPLDNSPLELALNKTLPCGQSFLWKRYWDESENQEYWLGVVDDTIVKLYQVGTLGAVYFQPVVSLSDASSRVEHIKKRLFEFFNLHIGYSSLLEYFCKQDPRFEKVVQYTQGARVLSLDPLECLCGYLCSSNNNIQRISQMMQYIAKHGDYIGKVQGHHFYRFPTLLQLQRVTEEDWRSHHFGYRAKYLVQCIHRLVELGGTDWLLELKHLEREQVVAQLMQLPGIGHKVASCIALVSLGKHDEIPVDTHIWQVVLKHYLPHLQGKSLTLRIHREIGEWFRGKFGAYAGWAHNTLFVGELERKRTNGIK
ncbi:hypothetical protein GAYE_PCTG60G1335 [Galdieria yellowstonensis]|uniref:DNA-(apurinic or apyrimidinic site) lyase n=1 Tax=Galdieria yellowstonensis TaxID=3028027 RepID=A0AAV9I783_9RHOD|nr:hypothetical protein GAYE_PCTG60G1335 [Galdieria yellowstonensis]